MTRSEEDILASGALAALFIAALDPGDVVALAARAGIEHPGMRLAALDVATLMDEVVDAVTADRKVREQARRYLDKACRAEIEVVSTLTAPEVEQRVATLPAVSSALAAWAWAIASDLREEVRGHLDTVVERFVLGDETREAGDDEFLAFLEEHHANPVFQAMCHTLDDAVHDAAAAQREADRLTKSLARQKLKTLEEHEEKKKLQEKLAKQSRSLHELQKRLSHEKPVRRGPPPAELEETIRQFGERNAELESAVAGMTDALQAAEEHALRADGLCAEVDERARFALAKKDEVIASIAEALVRIRTEAREARRRLIPPSNHVPDLFSTRADERVGVFVDVQNLYYAARDQYGGKLDYQKLLDRVVNGRRLIEACAYVVRSPDVDQTAFIDMLVRKGFIVRSKDLMTRNDGTTKGDWDVGIALDILDAADELDTVVLVSGDGDFLELVSVLKGRGVKVEVAAFPPSTAHALSAAADTFYPVDHTFIFESRGPSA